MAQVTEMTAGEVVNHHLETFFRKDVDKTLECLTDVVWSDVLDSEAKALAPPSRKD